MRYKIYLFLGFIISMVPGLMGADAFEGRYDMKFSGDGNDAEVTFHVKDGNVRMTVEDPKQQGTAVMIMRADMSSMLMVMPEQRMYMEMALPDDVKNQVAESEEAIQERFKKTGKIKPILGYKAYQFMYEEGNETVEIWATEEIGSMFFFSNPMMKGWEGVMKQVTGLASFFPLEMIGSKKGKEQYRMEVTEIEPKELPDSMFQPPEGYKKMSMPMGMGGFMNN